MKFQVSVLNDKGTKKVVLETVADRYEEERGGGRNALLSCHETHVRFYVTDYPGWWARSVDRLVASVFVYSSYVIEEASDAAYS